MGTMVLPLMFTYLTETYSMRGTLLLLAGIWLNCCVIGALLRPVPRPKAPHDAKASGRIKASSEQSTKDMHSCEKKAFSNSNEASVANNEAVEPEKQNSTKENVAPTDAPKMSSTDAPKMPSTDAPKMTPTDAPKMALTDAPKMAPTDAPKMTPTDAPKMAPIDALKMAPTDAPKMASTDAPKREDTKTQARYWSLLRNGRFMRIISVAFCGGFASFGAPFALPALVLELGSTKLMSSLVVTITGACEILSILIVAFTTDRQCVNRHCVLFCNFTLVAASGVVTFAFLTTRVVVVYTVVLGCFGLNVSPLVVPVIAESVDPGLLGSALGLYLLALGIGIAAAYPVLGEYNVCGGGG